MENSEKILEGQKRAVANALMGVPYRCRLACGTEVMLRHLCESDISELNQWLAEEFWYDSLDMAEAMRARGDHKKAQTTIDHAAANRNTVVYNEGIGMSHIQKPTGKGAARWAYAYAHRDFSGTFEQWVALFSPDPETTSRNMVAVGDTIQWMAGTFSETVAQSKQYMESFERSLYLLIQRGFDYDTVKKWNMARVAHAVAVVRENDKEVSEGGKMLTKAELEDKLDEIRNNVKR